MSSSTSSSQPQHPEGQTQPQENQTQPQEDQSQTPLPLPLPPSSSSTTTPTLDLSQNTTLKLDHLGPLVVNKDGSLSRIANWGEMTEIERRNTLRVLGKRNALRREGLMEKEGEGK